MTLSSQIGQVEANISASFCPGVGAIEKNGYDQRTVHN